MNLKKLTTSGGLVSSVLLAFIALISAQYKVIGWAIVIVIAVELYRLWQHGEFNMTSFTTIGPSSVVTLSLVLLIALSPQFATQILYTLLIIAWRLWVNVTVAAQKRPLLVGALMQFSATAAIFLGGAVWHWPTIIILSLSWVASYSVAETVMGGIASERATSLLVLSWALIVTECAWVFSLWMVEYVILGGYLIIPQAALVMTALAYCMGGIYVSHRQSHLSRARLVEYLMIALVILIIVITGTKWSGAI